MSDSGVVVRAGEVHEPAVPPRRSPRAGGLAGLAVVIVVIAAMAAIGTGSPPAPEPTDVVSPVVAPADSAEGAASATSSLPEIAIGWNRLDLPGRGTVVGLTYGSAGWMAVASGELSTVSTSPNGQVWVTHTFPGPLRGEVETLVTATQLVVVASDPDAGARSWVSSDGGVTWKTTLFPGGYAHVGSLLDAGDRLLAGGAVAADSRDLTDEDGSTTAAVWEYTDGVWVPTAFSDLPGPHSRVDALVVADDAVSAFGRAGGEPALWMSTGSSLTPHAVLVPRQAGGGTFSSVTQAVDGWWLAEFETRSGISYARSEDLVSWELIGSGFDGARAGSVAATDLGTVYVGEDDQLYRLVDRFRAVDVRYRYPDTATGFDPDRHTEVVATDGSLIVMGGGTFSPAIWIRGLEGGRVGVTAPPDPGDGQWRIEQRFGPGYWFEGPRPFQIVRSEEGFAIATPQGVWRTGDPVGDPPQPEPVEGDLVQTSSGLFVIDTRSRLLRHSGEDWIPEELSISVGGVTQSGDALLAYGWDPEGSPVVAVRPGGGPWTALPGRPVPSILPFAAAGGLLFGFEAGLSPAVAGRATADGVTWFPLDVDGLRGLENGVPFLVVGTLATATVVELLSADRLEAPVTVTVPSIDPLEIVEVGAVLRVRGSDGFWESRDGGEQWTELPIGIEQRLTGSIRIVPTEEPALLLAARDSYRVLTYQP